jgi:hypothetical protein
MAVTHISTITPSGSSATLEFTSISASYDDLLVIGTLKGQGAVWTPCDTGNSLMFGEGGTYWNSSADYNYPLLYDRYSTGTFLGYQNNYSGAGYSDIITAWGIPGVANDADNPGGFWLYVSGYAVTTDTVGRNWQMMSGCVSTATNAEEFLGISAGQITTSDAIDKMKFTSNVGNFTTSSKMSLYGISNS